MAALRHNQLKIIDETDLHTSVVKWIRCNHPECNIIAGLGELQDTAEKRLEAYGKGYMAGQPDLIIQNRSGEYVGLAIELKHPSAIAPTPSSAQQTALDRLELSGFRVMVSNNYDDIVSAIHSHMSAEIVVCKRCRRTLSRSDYLKHERRGDARRALRRTQAKRQTPRTRQPRG
jgi:hypothetical protein